MKASLKIRDDGKPLVRAKVPITILGLPFVSGLGSALDDARHLRLDLSTAFASGPSLRLAYRPNDPASPFALVLKTGLGALGSPDKGSPFSMAAEFGLLACPGGAGPVFSVRFKPQIGDFAVKKTITSATAAAIPAKPTPNGDGFEAPIAENHFEKKSNGFFSSDDVASGIHGLLSGYEVTASTVLPIRAHTALKFKWGLTVPPELRAAIGARTAGGISLSKLPLLTMSKISIERGSASGRASEEQDIESPERSSSVRRELESMRAENVALRKAVEELRNEVGGWKAVAPAVGRGGDSGKSRTRNPGTSVENAREELKKASAMGSAGAGRSPSP
ncbi:uncharacterized protein LOC122036831 [Zingiber officinale]|uniref:Uncharacterized protein n=1 Tax=Zingiber officinale TaxID=94328 RepID=A0A8J5BXF3_ZINOF|nr:uncharacterized protein LOC122036831 [Zingiber officinale]KAG6466991.1 hypothetical protein ZIOFF_075175 [Zingiber officinale]